jgi:uncharacterized membrane protein YhaH (DUF805 family)
VGSDLPEQVVRVSYEPYPTSPYGEPPSRPPADPRVAPLRGASFGEAVQRFFARYAVFRGRASRSEFWWVFLFNTVVEAVLNTLEAINRGFGVITALYGLAVLVPGLALNARRLHDTNRSGWWQLLVLIPVIGWIVLLIWYVQKEKPEGVRFDV